MMSLNNPAQRIGKALAPKKMANGGKVGKVKGPGTGTSDSVPAMLSDGEFVVPADSVQAVGKPALDALVKATHKPVGLAQMANTRPPQGLANGGSPWDAQYAKGGSLNVAGAPVSTAPIAAAPVPTPLANAAAVAPAVPPVGPSVTVPTPAVGPSVTAPVGPSVTAPTYTGSSSTPLQKSTDVTSLAGNYANGGAVKRPLAHYVNGTPPDELTMIDPTTGTPLPTTYHGDSGLSRAIRNPVGAINSMFGSSAGSDLPQPTPTPEIAAPTPLAAGMPLNSRSMDADGATIPEIDARIGSVPAPKEASPTPLAAAAIPSLGTTTEEVNRVAGAMNAQYRANDQQNNEQRQNRMILAGQAASDKFDAANAAQAARVSGGSILNAAAPGRRAAGFGEGGGRALLAEGLAAGALSRANASQSAFNGSPLAGYAQQAMNVQSAGEQAQRAGVAQQAGQLANAQGRMGLAQSAQMNPLAVQTAQQQLEQGKVSLAQHAQQLQALAALNKETDPTKLAQMRASYLATYFGKELQHPYSVAQIGGGMDPNNPMVQLPHQAVIVGGNAGDVRIATPTGQLVTPTPTQGGGGQPLPNHIAALKANPKLADNFDAQYGAGAAKKALAQ